MRAGHLTVRAIEQAEAEYRAQLTTLDAIAPGCWAATVLRSALRELAAAKPIVRRQANGLGTLGDRVKMKATRGRRAA